MKVKKLINKLNSLRSELGDDYYEKLLNFDFTVRVYKGDNLEIENDDICLYLDDVADELQVLVYLFEPEEE